MSRFSNPRGAASAPSFESASRPFAALKRLLPALFAAFLLATLAACAQDPAPAASAASPLPTVSPAPTSTPTIAPTSTPTAPPTSTPTPPPPVTFTDSAGRTLQLPARPPERIISLAPSTTEILFAIGAGITSEDVIDSLEALGILVVILDSPDIRAVAGSIRLAGLAVGETNAANRLATEIEARIEAVIANLEGAPRPRVFHELDASTPGRPFTIGPGNFVHDLITLAGGRNIFAAAASAFPQVGLEDVIARDPEVIILADAPFGATVESVKSRPGWDGLDAVLNDRILEVSTDLGNQLSRPGPRITGALEILARYLHPDLFQ